MRHDPAYGCWVDGRRALTPQCAVATTGQFCALLLGLVSCGSEATASAGARETRFSSTYS